METSKKVYEIVSRIPVGKVSTYGMIANLTNVRNPRIVGNLMHKNPDPDAIPCHRVVNSKGKVAKNYAFGGAEKQKQLLISEGINFRNEKVDLEPQLWQVKS